MGTLEVDVGVFVAQHFWPVVFGALGLGLLWLRSTYNHWTRRRYSEEALARLGRVNSSRESVLVERTTDRMLTAFFDAPKPTLRSLADDTETEFSLKP